MRVLQITFAFVFLACVSAVRAQETYLLRLKLEPGVINSYKVTTDMNGTMSGGMLGADQAQEMVIKQKMIMRHKLAGVKDGLGTFVTTFKDFDIQMTMGGMDISDFAGMDKDAVAKITVTSRVNERGETVTSKIEGLPESMAGASMTGGGNFNLMTLLPVFPENPVAIGESWECTLKNPMAPMLGDRAAQMKLPDVKMKCKLEGVEKALGVDCFRISTDIDFPVDMDLGAMMGEQQGGPSVKSTGRSKIKGTVWLDKETCTLVKQVFDTDSDMKIVMQGMGDMSMNIKMAGKGSIEKTETK